MLSWFSDRYLHLQAPQIIEAQIDMLTICTGALTLLRVKAINLSQLDTWSLSIPWPPCKLGEVASKKNSQDSKWLELYITRQADQLPVPRGRVLLPQGPF